MHLIFPFAILSLILNVCGALNHSARDAGLIDQEIYEIVHREADTHRHEHDICHYSKPKPENPDVKFVSHAKSKLRSFQQFVDAADVEGGGEAQGVYDPLRWTMELLGWRNAHDCFNEYCMSCLEEAMENDARSGWCYKLVRLARCQISFRRSRTAE